MKGKDRPLLQNTCKGRARASEQAVAGMQGPGLNEVVVGVETLSSVAYSDQQPDYLVSLLLEILVSQLVAVRKRGCEAAAFHGGWTVY